MKISLLHGSQMPANAAYTAIATWLRWIGTVDRPGELEGKASSSNTRRTGKKIGMVDIAIFQVL